MTAFISKTRSFDRYNVTVTFFGFLAIVVCSKSVAKLALFQRLERSYKCHMEEGDGFRPSYLHPLF